MTVEELIDHLKMFPGDMAVYICTTPTDLARPVARKLIRVIPASHDERYGLEQAKVLLTAFIPNDGNNL